MQVEGKVGSKGELFVPKKIREKLGLKPGKKVIFSVKKDKLIVEPIKSIEELLEKKPKIIIDSKEFHEFRESLSRRLEE